MSLSANKACEVCVVFLVILVYQLNGKVPEEFCASAAGGKQRKYNHHDHCAVWAGMCRYVQVCATRHNAMEWYNVQVQCTMYVDGTIIHVHAQLCTCPLLSSVHTPADTDETALSDTCIPVWALPLGSGWLISQNEIHIDEHSLSLVMRAEQLEEFGAFSRTFHACLVCGWANWAEFKDVHAIRFAWFCQLRCCSNRICQFFDHYPPRAISLSHRQARALSLDLAPRQYWRAVT